MTTTHAQSETWAIRPISNASSQYYSEYTNVHETERRRPVVSSNSRSSSANHIALEANAVLSRTNTFNWVKGEIIGKGSYGRVYLALNAFTGELMAVKQVESPQTASDRANSRQIEVVEALKFESEILKNLDHPNIVQYLGFEETLENLNIFLEYVPGGTIGSCLLKHGSFDEDVTKWFTVQILAGLEYLHSTGILHRDLKGDNILVETSGICKISDFGISKREDVKGQAFTELRGTIYWMAPEVVDSNKRGYDSKIDIWSVGCVVLEMWTGERPWVGEEVISVMLKLYKDNVSPPVPSRLTLSEMAMDFYNECFAMNPQARPMAGVLRQHPYLERTPGWEFHLSDIERSPARLSTSRKDSSNRHRNSSAPAPRHRRTATDVPPVPTKPRDSNTVRPTDHLQLPSIDTSTSRTARSPSRPRSSDPPPIVYITPPSSPVRVSSRSSMSPATSESTRTSASKTSASRTSASPQPRKSFHVVNPDPEPDDERVGKLRTPYVYNPPPLPPAADTLRSFSSRRSQRRGTLLQTRSIADFKAKERRLAPAPSMQDLAGRVGTSSSQQSSSRRNDSYSESDSDSNGGTMYWQKPPVELQKRKSNKSAHRRSIIETKRDSTWAPRPGLNVVYSHLQDFFPRVDLDKPITSPASSSQSERPRRTKSIRMVAEISRNNLENSTLQRRPTTKLWGHRVEEVQD
ncbi:kinase-like domain-containing protein [Mycena crocata]|nr:kinase-like domain-containing protein [Mycena crocata]